MSDRGSAGVPLEQFITALTSQLDRAQNAMAIKARLGYPLTFAVKDLTLDLRAHVDMVGSVVQLRPAGPGDEASTLRLALTTITRPMIEENTVQLASDPGEPTLQEAVGDELTEEERRRLEWAGVRTVSQLVELHRTASPDAVERVANVPATRLRAALQRASRPLVREVIPEAAPARPGIAPATRLRIRGHNLVREGRPAVSLAGQPVRVLEASARELLVEASDAAAAGTLEIATGAGLVAQMQLAAPVAAAEGGNGAAGEGYRDSLPAAEPTGEVGA